MRADEALVNGNPTPRKTSRAHCATRAQENKPFSTLYSEKCLAARDLSRFLRASVCLSLCVPVCRYLRCDGVPTQCAGRAARKPVNKGERTPRGGRRRLNIRAAGQGRAGPSWALGRAQQGPSAAVSTGDEDGLHCEAGGRRRLTGSPASAHPTRASTCMKDVHCEA